MPFQCLDIIRLTEVWSNALVVDSLKKSKAVNALGGHGSTLAVLEVHGTSLDSQVSLSYIGNVASHNLAMSFFELGNLAMSLGAMSVLDILGCLLFWRQNKRR
jgi:hypothetical protein